ncbi:MAG: hypothetical protein RLP14_10370 [Owenweeksia sp.]
MDETTRFRIDSLKQAGENKTDIESPPAIEHLSKGTAFQSYQIAGVNVTPWAIDCRQLKGKRFGLPYAYLTTIEYNPDPADERLIIGTNNKEVMVTGVSLTPIYEGLLSKRILWLSEVNLNLVQRYQELQGSGEIQYDLPVIVNITEQTI